MPVWSFRGRSLSFDRTVVMGILNVTPDSFSDGGRFFTPEMAICRAREIEAAGAGILDIGAQSTRPGYTPISPAEEWSRLEPVLATLHRTLTIPISVDTFYPEVAKAALDAGADILNDVSGSLENGFPALAAQTGAGLIMMHTGIGGETFGDVRDYFSTALQAADRAGLSRSQVCLDVGIGFGKSRAVDLELIARLPELAEAYPHNALLVGASRKRVVAEYGGAPPVNKRVPGTVALHTIAQWNGAHIVRAHDVAAAVQAAAITDALRAASTK